MHYHLHMNDKDEIRFLSKIKISLPDNCWEWEASKNKGGYGQFAVNKKPKLAHRVAWELKHGSIPNGLCVLHKCDNPPCVNVNHLFLGTRQDNLKDMRNKGRWVYATNHDAQSNTKRWNKFDKGQKELGRKRRPYYLTDSEKVKVDQLISEMRCEK